MKSSLFVRRNKFAGLLLLTGSTSKCVLSCGSFPLKTKKINKFVLNSFVKHTKNQKQQT